MRTGKKLTKASTFGLSLFERTQRIDVAGHFVNGMIKGLNNRLICSRAA
jgi:hypothetical protein